MSFDRQAARLEELPEVEIERVPCEPLGTFASRFRARAAAGGHHLVFLSQVFFGSGYVVPDLAGLVSSVRDAATVVVIDGYHGFWAVPTSLAAVQDRAFYVAGGYKYAQSGEGTAFLHVPRGCTLRPLHTGWFADFGALGHGDRDGVAFSDDAFRFWGATFDPTGLYRFNAVNDWLQELGVTVEVIHDHVRSLQRRFLTGLSAAALPLLPAPSLVTAPDLAQQGHFLAFRLAGAPAVARALAARNVSVDVRGDHLRIGFGVYHDAADVDRLLDRLLEASRLSP
jgi:kynureninase